MRTVTAEAPKNLVFILGIGRSGSTMLDLMLGSHSQGFSLGEISKVPEIIARHGNAQALYPGSSFWPARFSQAEVQRLAAGLSNHRIHAAIPLKLERQVRELLGCDQIFRPYTLLFDKIQRSLLVDSSKYPDWVASKLKTHELQDGKIRVFIIHAVRDGRAVLNSYLRAFPNLAVDELAQRWMDNLAACERILKTFPADRQIQVRYEHLATDPIGVVKSVCNWLNISYEPDMIEYWKHEHHYVAGSRSTRALINRYRNHSVDANVQTVHGDYYQKIDLAIKLDQRWKQELAPEKLARFSELVEEKNQPFQWDDERTELATQPV